MAKLGIGLLMGRGRKPKVDWNVVNKIVDDAHEQPLSDDSHRKLKATVNLLENYFSTEQRNSEKQSKPEEPKKGKKKRKGGSGRNGADDHPSAKRQKVDHESLKPGDCCPDCTKGRVYSTKNPATSVHIEAQPLVEVTVLERQKLKCNFCDAVHVAAPPEGFSKEKYDETVPAMLALTRYGSGMPGLRLEGLLRQFGVLLPDSTQWELVRDAADQVQALVNELICYAANSKNLYTDDTSMKMIEQKRHLPGRTGLFTTAIVAEGEEGKVALYFTGEQHAGENLGDLLRHRAETVSPPTVMFDALTRNHPKAKNERIELVLSYCLAHGRRNFVYAQHNFPDECNHLISEIGQVYQNDAKTAGLDPEARLIYHQIHSTPVLEHLHTWATKLQDEGGAEPNSGLGKAIAYLLKHWTGLTEFLRTPGAGLDNNICERAIKKMVLYRKNSLFYRNENGSSVGDIFMSIIHTCELNGVRAFPYLVDLLKRSDQVQANPKDWLPWVWNEQYENKAPPLTAVG